MKPNLATLNGLTDLQTAYENKPNLATSNGLTDLQTAFENNLCPASNNNCAQGHALKWVRGAAGQPPQG